MIELKQGNLLEVNAEALVNTVNCVGIMGKGIALQFKQAFPENYRRYVQACRRQEVSLGKMFIVPITSTTNTHLKYIINFPTKYHWTDPSNIDDIKNGLNSLIEDIQRLHIQTIAMPPIGCGNGGLSWRPVRQQIELAFAKTPNTQLFLFEPSDAPNAAATPIAAKTPNMTNGRALLLKLMDVYHQAGYTISRLEIQKLAYFLQAAGEPLRLEFVKHQYGPYARNLHFVLQNIDGYFINGYGNGSARARITLVAEAVAQAESIIQNIPQAQEHVNTVSHLIEGFDNPSGMELLATVHWVAQEEPSTDDVEILIQRVHAWSPRKKDLFKREYIIKAWERLQREGWFALRVTNPAG